ncbi:MAG: hypothetical protein GXO87_04135 [Chlorobi bacterium]|nr:hypothetical protein [Chlorobiota bacterium]
MANSDGGFENLEVIEYLKNLESRVSRIEARFRISPNPSDELSTRNSSEEKDQNLSEQRIGEFWFANLGILVLVFFFTFLIIEPFNGYNQFIPPAIGLAAVFILIGASFLAKNHFLVISNELFGSGLFILFVAILRLFNFSPEPALQNIILEAFLLSATSLGILLISYRRKALLLNVIGLLLLAATGLILNIGLALFIILLMLAGVVSYLYSAGVFKNTGYLMTGIFITYISFAAWVVNNPFLGNELKINDGSIIGIAFLHIYMLIFAYPILMSDSKNEKGFNDIASFINTAMCFIIYTGFVLTAMRENAALLETFYFITSLGLASLFWIKKQNKYSTYFYSMASFVALSVVILLTEAMPNSLLYLIWQSVIIIGLAVWFKSKSIIITNFIIYLTITVAYFMISEHFELGGLSIGFAALFSARLLNWQKNKLTIKTEFLRNTYLAVAFVSIPITLFSALESGYIGLSVIGLAMLYYLMSSILNNLKYRWMAHLTLLISIVYIIGYWFTNESSPLQLFTLAALAVTLIFVSVFFTRKRTREKTTLENSTQS